MEPFLIAPMIAAIIWTAFSLYKDIKKEKSKFKNGEYIPEETGTLSERLFHKNKKDEKEECDLEIENTEYEEIEEVEETEGTEESEPQEPNSDTDEIDFVNQTENDTDDFLKKIKKRRNY